MPRWAVPHDLVLWYYKLSPLAPTLTHARYSTFARILHTLHHDGFRYRC